MSLPVEILINEHKLILQAVGVIKQETDKMRVNNAVDANFIVATVDFFRTYADRFHHGKEEGILFKGLSQKKLSEADRKMMNELTMEHAFARRTVKALESAKESYVSGNKDAAQNVLELFTALVKLYPAHIEKEDKHFFYPCMEYFSLEEREEMRRAFVDFNQNFTDKQYAQIVSQWKK